ncbi:MAG TPA: Fe(2+)-trafficking protein [Gemmatales bacterium]|nr:Fe(2+)-trafficking protein [Gemmatales bacterium]HMP15840.1 Fe(2+)-trafficking protein [Gemmatales bacterium]
MNTALQERIAQFRKMTQDDPENELGHFSLGKALFEDGQFVEAAVAFQKTVELNKQFSKAYQLLGQSLVQAGNAAGAIPFLTQGFEVADERGENIPRDEMARLLREIGAPVPESKRSSAANFSGEGGFACQRPGCSAGPRAVQLQKPPMSDELGQQVYKSICAQCWQDWLGMGVKVINEMRLDLSDEKGQEVYDQYMKEYLGF